MRRQSVRAPIAATTMPPVTTVTPVGGRWRANTRRDIETQNSITNAAAMETTRITRAGLNGRAIRTKTHMAMANTANKAAVLACARVVPGQARATR